MDKLVTFIFFISLFSSFGTLFLGIKQRFTLLWYYAATGFAFDVVMSILGYYFAIKGDLLSNIFIAAEFLFISYFYKKYIYKNNVTFNCVTYSALLIYILWTLNSPFEFNTPAASCFCIIFMIYSLISFYSILKAQQILNLGKSYFFWVNVAVLIYASGAFLLFLFRIYLQKENIELFNLLWRTFFRSLNTIRYLLIGIALYKKSRE
jgi:hypothetical protein